MPRTLLSACACALCLSTTAFASTSVTRSEALDAIHVFEANATGAVADPGRKTDPSDAVAGASNTILRFALESDQVVVDLGIDSVPWCDVKKGLADIPQSSERGLLLAAYLSGCVKAQLLSGKQNANPFEGWVAMLKVYRTLRLRESVRIPEVEALLERQVKGTLEAYAAEALERSSENLRKSYGPAGAAKPATPEVATQP
jgi:hypothetical protein